MKTFVMVMALIFGMVGSAIATDCHVNQQQVVQRVVQQYPQRVVVRQQFVEVPAYEVQQVVVQKQVQKVQRQRVLGGRSRSFSLQRSVQR